MIVLWRVTQRCNLSCPFCAYDQRLNSPRLEADVLSIRRFGAVLSEYQGVTGDRVLVSWIGGEPFLFPQLSELTVLFKQMGLRVSATTNGTMLGSAKVREHVLAFYDELTVSVDGIGSVHDGLRGWRGGYDMLHKAVVQLAEMRRKRQPGPRLRANIVLMRQTIHNFEQLCLELATWGFDEITFNQLGGRDRPEFFPAHRLLPEDSAWLTNEIPHLRARLAGLGVNLSGGDNYLLRIRASSRDERIPVANCRPGEQFLFISEDSIASPCNFTTQTYGVSLEELDCADALRELPKRFARLLKEKPMPCCRDCHSTHVFAKFVA